MTDRRYIGAQELLEDSFRLAVEIANSGFRPDFIIGIWRGGTPVGIAVQELLDHVGIDSDHIAIRTSSYIGEGERGSSISVHGMGYMIRKLNREDSLLIVDDVFDTGLSIEAVLNYLTARTRRNTPQDIRVATPWFKPGNNKTTRVPDYWLHETDQWLVFPHELSGLEQSDIEQAKPEVARVLAQLNMPDPSSE